MVRPKHGELFAESASKNTFGGFTDLLNSKIEVGLPEPEEDGWLIVKKQKVNILMPPLLALKQSNITDPEPGHPQPMLGKRGNKPSQPKTFPVNESKIPMSVACRKDIEVVRKFGLGRPTSAKLSKQDFVIESNNMGRDVPFRSYKTLRVLSPMKTIRRQRPLLRPINLSDAGVSASRRLRASNLERKLQRAGGLSRWLTSLGLSQFARIFQSRRVGKFHLINLTMKKLKDMGADAVGPRRKLMHAIDCLCQPHCFEKKRYCP